MSGVDLSQLALLMAELRDPAHGCPWDRRQTLDSLSRFAVEEAYEVQDAARRGAWDELRSELGDLLFQVVFFSQIAQEERRFTLSDIAQTLHDKLLVRHPHVWPDGTRSSFGQPAELTEAEVNAAWEARKAIERQARGDAGVLDDVPATLPAMQRAQKLQSRAARVGFDWPDLAGVRDKIDEELAELDATTTSDAQADELGDLLFTLVNYARKAGLDAESVLAQANAKFEQRFAQMELEGPLEGDSSEQLEARWARAKARG
mgnify:CR=1 FL=1